MPGHAAAGREATLPDDLLSLDRELFGADRPGLLRSLAAAAPDLVLSIRLPGGALRGYALKDHTQSMYMLATLLEDALDVSKRDRMTSKMILSLVVEKLLRHAFVKAGRFQPRQKDLLADLNSLDPELGRLARRYYGRKTITSSSVRNFQEALGSSAAGCTLRPG